MAQSTPENCYSRINKTIFLRSVTNDPRPRRSARSKTPVNRDNRKLDGIDSALERIVGRSLRAAPASESPVLAWPLACGSAVADRTRALEFSKGVLAVAVPDAGWRAELQRLAPQYLAVINRYTAKNVNRIEFVVQKSSG